MAPSAIFVEYLKNLGTIQGAKENQKHQSKKSHIKDTFPETSILRAFSCQNINLIRKFNHEILSNFRPFNHLTPRGNGPQSQV
jgi:hypothetical protein